ncbi:MAG: RsmD family RNA methyltransferase [candidate division Zixibacteria bacterium]|nr:RsmD family RNA methyltransferase [candidate division Zixibacteria bacterium]
MKKGKGNELFGEPKTELEFRVIAGTLKGKRIVAPNLGITRPPLTRIRKSIFDFLMPYIGGASYLDLFSGTGSYLFEAVSRGAIRAIGVEREKKLAVSINAQAEAFGLGQTLHCQTDDVFAAIPKLAKQGELFDIIMIAPPQYLKLIDKTLALLRAENLTGSETLILTQHDSNETYKINLNGFELLQRRKYGNTTFTVLRGAEGV